MTNRPKTRAGDEARDWHSDVFPGVMAAAAGAKVLRPYGGPAPEGFHKPWHVSEGHAEGCSYMDTNGERKCDCGMPFRADPIASFDPVI